MDKITRQTQLRQRLRQLKQQQDHELAQQTLEQLGISPRVCTYLLPNDRRGLDSVAWLKYAFPWQWAQIDWAQVPGSECVSWETNAQLAFALSHVCNNFELGNPSVTVIWFNARHPILQTQLSVAQQYADKLLTHDWDTWIVEPIAGWCIECHHEGTLCWGYGTEYQSAA